MKFEGFDKPTEEMDVFQFQRVVDKLISEEVLKKENPSDQFHMGSFFAYISTIGVPICYLKKYQNLPWNWRWITYMATMEDIINNPDLPWLKDIEHKLLTDVLKYGKKVKFDIRKLHEELDNIYNWYGIKEAQEKMRTDQDETH